MRVKWLCSSGIATRLQRSARSADQGWCLVNETRLVGLLDKKIGYVCARD